MSVDFRTLSDSLGADELAVYFRQFLEEYGKKPKTLDALKQLYELAYRQWDTYEELDQEIAVRLEEYLMAAINFKSYDITDLLISIVENLTLKKVFQYIIDAKSSVSSPAIRKLITEAEEEYADTIDNPYDDLDEWI